MDFFISLSEIGSTTIVNVFSSLIDFFNTPLDVLAGLNYSASEIVITQPTIAGYIPHTIFGKVVAQVYSWFSPSPNPEPVPFFSTFVGILKLLGLDTSLPLWAFVMSNIGILLLGSLALRVVSAFT